MKRLIRMMLKFNITSFTKKEKKSFVNLGDSKDI